MIEDQDSLSGVYPARSAGCHPGEGLSGLDEEIEVIDRRSNLITKGVTYMEFIIVGKNIDVTPGLRQAVEDKIGKLERYFTLLNLPVSETWNFKLVFMGYTGLSMQFPFFDTSIKRSNQLYIDGMFNGRGWEIYNTDEGRGCTVWSNYAEIRMPLVPGVLTIDGFFDAIAIKDSVSDFFSGLTDDDWYYSFGPSIRFTIPQLPIRLLFANTFRVQNGNVVWCDQDGDPNSNKWYSNFHFKFSFTNINY